MGALRDLWHSERAVVTLAVLVAAAVLVGVGKVTGHDWLDFARWIAGGYVGSKAVTGAVEAWASRGGKPDA